MTAVVNVMVKRRDRITSCVDKRDECKRTADEASKTGEDGIQNRELHLSWEEHSGYLLTGYAVSGV